MIQDQRPTWFEPPRPAEVFISETALGPPFFSPWKTLDEAADDSFCEPAPLLYLHPREALLKKAASFFPLSICERQVPLRTPSD